jgi:hypothetical protein
MATRCGVALMISTVLQWRSCGCRQDEWEEIFGEAEYFLGSGGGSERRDHMKHVSFRGVPKGH